MGIRSWITSSFVRNYPATKPGRATSEFPVFDVALNESFSFQVVVRSSEPDPVQIQVEAQAPKGCSIQVRRVGYVPMPHHNTSTEMRPSDCEGIGHVPGFVPDPLFNEQELLLPSCETHAFWITVRPGRGVRPGTQTVRVAVQPEKGTRQRHSVKARIHDIRLKKRKKFSVTNWFYVDSLIDWYKTDLFDKRFWQILQPYLRDMVSHGQDTVYVPVFTPPLDGVKRPSQLLRVQRTGKDRYRFDWRHVKKYIDLARRNGITNFEWCHPFSQWGVEHALRIYKGQGETEELLWAPKTGATSNTYRAFLSQFLPELHAFLKKEKLLKKSFFHVSDEPHADKNLANYQKARALLKELAPWMKVMDALTEIEFARQGLTDMPIPSIKTALDFVKEDIPCWCYYCCGPRGKYLNRLMDTPLAKIGMHGFLFYRWPFKGFLHWGHNYWQKCQASELIDPYTVQDAGNWPGWAYGDTFVVYPGPEGPIDSIRWEVFGEAMQDYALLQTLGVKPNDPLFRSIRSFENFPKTERWRHNTRAKLFARV